MYMTLNPPEGVGFAGYRASMHGYDVIGWSINSYSITDVQAVGKTPFSLFSRPP
jgi:hypothetical protein